MPELLRLSAHAVGLLQAASLGYDGGNRPEAEIERNIEMTKMNLEVFSDASNYAVIATPGRRFPGSVIQGDSLSSLFGDVRQVALWVQSHSAADDDVRWTVQEIQQQLLDRLLHYQSVLQTNGIALPYAVPVASADLVKLLDQVS